MDIDPFGVISTLPDHIGPSFHVGPPTCLGEDLPCQVFAVSNSFWDKFLPCQTFVGAPWMDIDPFGVISRLPDHIGPSVHVGPPTCLGEDLPCQKILGTSFAVSNFCRRSPGWI